ncbi:LemA family protein [Maricaulis maris]|uniref:LemA protein n=1 Tax=Maricaulis maris TaxID=74318 RepID=A0A495DJY1_9PROT|nr:LemA family protein [Maricaulis maris]RKR02919.1 LemA protein [Maricaulis maris]
MDTGLILLLVIIALGVFLVMVYNRLVALRQTCNQAWGDIDVQLKQRHDLVPNLVSTVQGYASHEKETLENVIKARQTAIDATSVKDLAGAENMLSGALRQLFALSEAYPDLKANQNFMQLQAELSDLENKIAAARRFFNNAVNEYNTSTEQFPAVVIANAMGFKMREYFEVAEAERGAPKVQF